MKSIWAFVAGIAAAAAVAQLASWRRRVAPMVDLNTCSREDLLRLAGVDEDLAERIFENRPYRSKFDLINRLVIPDTVYRQVHSRLSVDEKAAHQSVQVAS